MDSCHPFVIVSPQIVVDYTKAVLSSLAVSTSSEVCRHLFVLFRARQIGCPDARDNQKKVLGNQYLKASCPVGNREYFSNFPSV